MSPTLNVLPPETKISSTYLPLLNPYSAFEKKSCNPWMQIHSLVQQKPKGVNEYVVVSKLDQHPILANQEEQFITLQMRRIFPGNGKSWHANFGTSEITLNTGTIFVTIFPNFNMSRQNPYMTEALKIQVQILGAPKARDAI
ncbi:hypothetical protein R3W88_000937 [Solanum pinnatisectum]|uniref:Uncharacterized protein n=1 Tax=Solanum pinnatisectum TaxID=50273 RepID=A0AAV9MK62_9SOLN|nr:hypothetical protein R3W88_000937 [Solanum pinnatisectum]